ncbi:MAG: hypothetical protein GQE15_35210 [Archangiaceae bacterium]|nr:hypothetical protein [Archangiaceae bacterium]
MSEPTAKPPFLKAATVIWAIVIVAALACTATGVVTLFGSKFGPGFDPDRIQRAPSTRRLVDFAADAGAF